MTDEPRLAVDPARPLRAQPTVGHNRWHPEIEPVLAVAPGETFSLETIDPRRATASSVGPAFMTTGLPLRDDGTLAPDDLMLAARNAALELVGWLQAHCELDFGAAYTLASIAGELRIAQLVNSPSPTVTLALPLEVFETPPSGIR